jgi:hypothetical protein
LLYFQIVDNVAVDDVLAVVVRVIELVSLFDGCASVRDRM